MQFAALKTAKQRESTTCAPGKLLKLWIAR
nr:MAG TPA: hypothetical protein [Caudoviricetes sp.]